MAMTKRKCMRADGLNKRASLLASSVELGAYADDKNFTFEKWAERWFKIAQADVSQNTKRNYPFALTKTVHLDPMHLRDIRRSDMQEALSAQSGKYET